MAEPSDEELVRRIRAGDAAASEALVRRYAPRLHAQARRTLRGIVRRRMGDSDVVQEAHLAAFRALDRFEDRGEGSFARWLATILERKANDAVRRQVGAAKRGADREVSRSAGDPEPDPASAGPTPSAAAIGRESAAEIRAALERIPAAYRAVLDLVHLGGMTLAQAGETLGRSPNATVKVYGRAVRALARELRSGGRVPRGR